MSFYSRISSHMPTPFKFVVPTVLLVDGGVNGSTALAMKISSLSSCFLPFATLAIGSAQVYASLYLMDRVRPLQEKGMTEPALSAASTLLVYIPISLAVEAGMNYVLPKSAPIIARTAIGIIAQTSIVTILATALVVTSIFFMKNSYERARAL